MRRLSILLICFAIMTSFTACTTRSELAESEDTPEEEISESVFDSTTVADSISAFAKNHGMYEKNTLCYKSNSYYKLDSTRYESEFELKQAYEDAVRDLVAQGNFKKSKSTYYFVESVQTDEKGNFIIYIDYEYDTGR